MVSTGNSKPGRSEEIPGSSSSIQWLRAGLKGVYLGSSDADTKGLASDGHITAELLEIGRTEAKRTTAVTKDGLQGNTEMGNATLF